MEGQCVKAIESLLLGWLADWRVAPASARDPHHLKTLIEKKKTEGTRAIDDVEVRIGSRFRIRPKGHNSIYTMR